MPKPDRQIFDDIARLAGGAAGLLNGLRDEIRRDIAERFDSFATRLDLVPRKDFDHLQAQVDSLRSEIEELRKDAAPKKPAPKTSSKS